jgi:hypothetical protein
MGMKMKMNYSPILGTKMKMNHSPILGTKMNMNYSLILGIKMKMKTKLSMKLKPHLALRIIKSKCDRNYSVKCSTIIESVTRILPRFHNLCLSMAFQGNTLEQDTLPGGCEDSRFLIGGGRHGKFAGEVIAKYIHDDHGLKDLSSASFMFEYQCKIQDVGAAFEKYPCVSLFPCMILFRTSLVRS